MLRVGLTGGIASGKSLVSRVFQDLGAHVIDADRVVHCLLEPGQRAWQEVVAHFGRDILAAGDHIDRRTLGAIVFRDAGEREWLNSCLHPRVFDVYVHQVSSIRSRHPDAIVVLDAALLIESGYYRKMESIVVVTAGVEQQYERLIARDRFTREQARIRIESQMPVAEKTRFADHVIDNSGTREETEQQAREVFRKLVNREAAQGS